MSKNTLDAAWKQIRKRAGLSGVRVHDLRHTYATHLGATGVNAFQVRDLLGHKDVETTRAVRVGRLEPATRAATAGPRRLMPHCAARPPTKRRTNEEANADQDGQDDHDANGGAGDTRPGRAEARTARAVKLRLVDLATLAEWQRRLEAPDATRSVATKKARAARRQPATLEQPVERPKAIRTTGFTPTPRGGKNPCRKRAPTEPPAACRHKPPSQYPSRWLAAALAEAERELRRLKRDAAAWQV